MVSSGRLVLGLFAASGMYAAEEITAAVKGPRFRRSLCYFNLFGVEGKE
jgi:hypothetical protein